MLHLGNQKKHAQALLSMALPTKADRGCMQLLCFCLSFHIIYSVLLRLALFFFCLRLRVFFASSTTNLTRSAVVNTYVRQLTSSTHQVFEVQRLPGIVTEKLEGEKKLRKLVCLNGAEMRTWAMIAPVVLSLYAALVIP
jgi:hypothetical protein